MHYVWQDILNLYTYVLWKYVIYLLKYADEFPPEFKPSEWAGKRGDSTVSPLFLLHLDKPSVWDLPSSSHRRSRRWFMRGQCKHVSFARWLFIPSGSDGVSQTSLLIIARLSSVICSPLWIQPKRLRESHILPLAPDHYKYIGTHLSCSRWKC